MKNEKYLKNYIINILNNKETINFYLLLNEKFYNEKNEIKNFINKLENINLNIIFYNNQGYYYYIKIFLNDNNTFLFLEIKNKDLFINFYENLNYTNKQLINFYYTENKSKELYFIE